MKQLKTKISERRCSNCLMGDITQDRKGCPFLTVEDDLSTIEEAINDEEIDEDDPVMGSSTVEDIEETMERLEPNADLTYLHVITAIIGCEAFKKKK